MKFKLFIIVALIIFEIFILMISIHFISSSITFKKETGIIEGKVFLRSGNCMPRICSGNSSCTSKCLIKGVKRKIVIRDINDLSKKPIKTFWSNNNGSYFEKIPEGNYSVFVIDQFKEYCNKIAIVNGSVVSCPLNVQPDNISNYNVTINRAVE